MVGDPVTSTSVPISVDLSAFRNDWYQPGRSQIVRALWFFVGQPLVRASLLPSSAFRRTLLRLFGAKVGRGTVFKPGVRVKYPWLLSVGENTWIGEDVWIDNLAAVDIGANACLSQAVYCCTGNHNWSDPAFGLVLQKITIQDGAWIGARAVLCPGVTVYEGAVAVAGSVVTKSIPAYEIHAGNPAGFMRHRQIKTSPTPT